MSLTARIFWWIIIFVFTISIDIFLIRVWRNYRKQLHFQKHPNNQMKRSALLKKVVMKEFSNGIWKDLKKDPSRYRKFKRRLQISLELLFILLWAIYFGRGILDFDPHTWLWGREFGSQILTHHLWTNFQECGLCALWNGDINGGYPSLADIFGSMLHPFVAITTLIWGTIIGTKVSIVLSLAIAGIAQWWIARILSVGWLSRMWSAMMVIVAGHLSGRLEIGAIGIIISTATASLLLAFILELRKKQTLRAMVLLAVVGAITIVSGQGYIQLGVIAWSPSLVLLLLDKNFKVHPIWKKYVSAILLSILLAGVFLVPMLHFFPEIQKDVDPNFNSAQSLDNLLLNLFIRDWDYMNSTVLGKLPYPYLYNIYIGWIPVVFSLFCLRFSRKSDERFLLALVIGSGSVLLMASGIPLRKLMDYMPMLSGFRHIPIAAGLAVPGILGLAAYGLDCLWKLNWPRITISSSKTSPILDINSAWLLLLPMFISIRLGYEMNINYLKVQDQYSLYQDVSSLQTHEIQWVATPFGELFWVEPVINQNLKLVDVNWAWKWVERKSPEPFLFANRDGAPQGYTKTDLYVNSIPIYFREEASYAAVIHEDQLQPCTAKGLGGKLTIHCNTSSDGRLIVKENSWSGWKAWMDGERTPLLRDQWLSVDAPAGKHIYHFRYRPWDVPLGLSLSLIGIVICIYLWFSKPKDQTSMNSQIKE